MSARERDPRCPECGEPIGLTATYCMHCSADLTDERRAADVDGDGTWDRSGGQSADAQSPTVASSPAFGDRVAAAIRSVRDALDGSSSTDAPATDTPPTGTYPAETAEDGDLLAPDGLVDDTLTVVVGIVGGLVVGVVGTFVLGILTGSGLALVFGLAAWLGATAYLVRRRTVQEAVAKSGYGVALVLALVPVVALSPVTSVDGGLAERGGLFLVLVVFVAVPAGVAAAVGWVASRFVPGDDGGDAR